VLDLPAPCRVGEEDRTRGDAHNRRARPVPGTEDEFRRNGAEEAIGTAAKATDGRSTTAG
jgi:hypothetical protein